MRPTAARELGLLLAFALALRLAAVFWWQARLPEGEPLFFGDSLSYWTLARSVAQGQPYQYGSPHARVFRTPGYPVLLAPLFLALGPDPPVIAARMMGAVFGTAAVALVWWLARRLFGPRAGSVAGIAAAAYPEAIAASVLVLSEAPFCPLMLGHLAVWTLAWQAASPRRRGLLAGGAGLLAGAATLVRPSWLLFAPSMIVVGAVFGPRRSRHLAIGAVMLTGLVAALLPWWIRCAQVTGRFVPTTLQVGASLYDGLNPGADGSSAMEFVESFARSERWLETYRGETKDAAGFEYRLDRAMRREALDWTWNHPTRTAELALIKFRRMWSPWPNQRSLSTPAVRVVVAATYLPVLALGLLGAGRSIRRGWPCVMCWLPAAYFTLLHVVFVSSIRYRLPAMLGLIVLAAGVAAAWWPDRPRREEAGHG